MYNKIIEVLSMHKVKKAIIPAAGLGTRFLPATKSLPKEMFTIIDTPTIQYIVEEAVKSGIEEICIITNSTKHIMENHFDYNFELETRLKERGEIEKYEEIRKIPNMCKIFYVRQLEPKGLGHAILCAKEFINNEPFAVLLGDDLMVNEKPVLKQLIEKFNETNCSILGAQTVPKKDVCKYGNITPNSEMNNRIIEVKDLVEKPKVEEAKSQLAVLGRYVLTPTIFKYLETQERGKGNEIQLTDAIRRMLKEEKVYAYDFEGIRYDIGDKFGYVKAIIDFALKNPELKEKTEEYINSIKK